ncbi:MAG: TolC family protein [Phycisphaerae bacterium]
MRPTAIVLLLLTLGGCARYQARPIQPVRLESDFHGRTLSDPRLLAYIQRHPLSSKVASEGAWDLDRLTLAALYYHPDLVVARAQLKTAKAGIRSASALPNPSVSVSPGWESVLPRPLYGAALDLPIETAGKRERRIEEARALSDAARLRIEQVAWNIRGAVRSALVDFLITRQQVESLRAEADARAALVKLAQQRLKVGKASGPEVELLRLESTNAALALRSAEGRVGETQAMLAGAIGIPTESLQDVHITWAALEHIPGKESLSAATLQSAGLLNRADIRQSLAEYAAADVALRLEIAKQYPDVHLSPDYAFDEGVHKYTIGMSLTLPLFDQNQGPIAEAEARREEVAAQFLALQTRIISDTQIAWARYQGAYETLNVADQALSLAEKQQDAVKQAFVAGAGDQVSLAGASVETAVAVLARIDALRGVQSALGALESATQHPLGSDVDPATSAAVDNRGEHG